MAWMRSVVDIFSLEIIRLIFLNVENPMDFSLTCRTFYSISSDEINKANYLLKKYGRGMVLYAALIEYPKILTPTLLEYLVETRGVRLAKSLTYDTLCMKKYISTNIRNDTITKFSDLHRKIYGCDVKNYKILNLYEVGLILQEISYCKDGEQEKRRKLVRQLASIITNTNYFPIITHTSLTKLKTNLNIADRQIYDMCLYAPEIMHLYYRMGFYLLYRDIALWIKGFITFYKKGKQTKELALERLNELCRLGIIEFKTDSFYFNDYWENLEYIDIPYYEYSLRGFKTLTSRRGDLILFFL